MQSTFSCKLALIQDMANNYDALHCAVQNNDLDCVELLLQHHEKMVDDLPLDSEYVMDRLALALSIAVGAACEHDYSTASSGWR